jgi:hypothetical protein
MEGGAVDTDRTCPSPFQPGEMTIEVVLPIQRRIGTVGILPAMSSARA